MPRNDVLDVDVNDLTPHITLHLRLVGTRRFGVRRWIAVRLIRLAARVMGMPFVVTSEAEYRE